MANEDTQTRTDTTSRAVARHRLGNLELIATGGTAHVYRARQKHLERWVAIKQLKEELESQQETRERFRREARALAALVHTNIAHVYDFVEEGTSAYLLMEYLDGVDLSTVIEKVGSMPPQVAATVLLAVGRGVDYLHGRGIIHRDIKPANVRLTTAGDVKLMDFGIALDPADEGLTRPGSMVGSPSYLSPEQVLGDPLTSKSDVFLLGITLYEMLTGLRPFRAEQGETVYQRIRDARYVPIRQVRRRTPPALARIVERCLRKQPDRRYSSVKKVLQALEKYLGAEATAHGSDVVLAFLDREALVEPSVRFSTPAADRAARAWQTWGPVFFALLGGLVLGYGLAYWQGLPAKEDSLKSYPPPKPAARPTPT